MTRDSVRGTLDAAAIRVAQGKALTLVEALPWLERVRAARWSWPSTAATPWSSTLSRQRSRRTSPSSGIPVCGLSSCTAAARRSRQCSAGYAEAGVLKRYGASGVSALRVVTAQAATCLVSVLAGSGLVLAAAAPVYGVPEVRRPLWVIAVLALGVAMVLTLGVALGLLVRSVRVANALGLTLFFPMFILGGGGPPAAVMMRDIADVLPLTHLTTALQPGLAARPLPGARTVVAARLVGPWPASRSSWPCGGVADQGYSSRRRIQVWNASVSWRPAGTRSRTA